MLFFTYSAVLQFFLCAKCVAQVVKFYMRSNAHSLQDDLVLLPLLLLYPLLLLLYLHCPSPLLLLLLLYHLLLLRLLLELFTTLL